MFCVFFLDKITFYFLIDAGLLLNRNIMKLNLDNKLVKTFLKGRRMFIYVSVLGIKQLRKMKTKSWGELKICLFSIYGIYRTSDLVFTCTLLSFSSQ